MPHVTLEYSANLPGLHAPAVLASLHAALVATGKFQADDIKGRAYRCHEFRIGLELRTDAFVHLEVQVMAGRDPDFLRLLPARLLGVLGGHLPPSPPATVHCTVHVSELASDRYAKQVHRAGASVGTARPLRP